MARPIKFRAWNATTNTMVDLYKITPLAVSVNQKGVFVPFADDLKLMQFTGRLDRNGLEIYEGDWIRCEQRTDSIIVHQGAVFYSEDELAWCLQLSHGYGREPLTRYSYLEVIGNIYAGSSSCVLTAQK